MSTIPQTAPEELQVRVHGAASLPTLIYLPGLHGDWTLIGSFRHALAGRVRFVEITYPRTLIWTLEDYANAVEQALAKHGIRGGWLLGESFGSQVLWPLLARSVIEVQGLILAGGFVQHPMRWGARFAERVVGGVSLRLVTTVIFGYSKIARFRFRNAPETMADLDEFFARRTELDRQAATHRLHLVAENDPCVIARQLSVPLFGLTGVLDPIVPWFLVRRWLKGNCANLREYRILWRADHNVLSTAPRTAADQVVRWMSGDYH
jgi:pimeloyl-ACP methyl ester carboxylesterase